MILLSADTASGGLSSRFSDVLNLLEFICGVTRKTPPLTEFTSMVRPRGLVVDWDRGNRVPSSLGGVPSLRSFKKSSMFAFPEFLSYMCNRPSSDGLIRPAKASFNLLNGENRNRQQY